MVRSDELEVSDLHALRVDECGADDIFGGSAARGPLSARQAGEVDSVDGVV
jgi:hypothetical protein